MAGFRALNPAPFWRSVSPSISVSWDTSNTPVSSSQTWTIFLARNGRCRTSSCQSASHSSPSRKSHFWSTPIAGWYATSRCSITLSSSPSSPQLIAGPITQHSEIMPQIGPSRRRDLTADLAVGISVFVVGLFKKVVIADSLAIYADAGYSMLRAGHPLDSASAWVTVLCYSFQLYYDFSGYSDMAVGLARMFGFRLPVNFYSPYKSTSIIDFWRRWHITLSRFLRDYLYIPLGGNRRGPVRRYANLGIVMLLGGLWHGANWTFVVWGAVHGLMLALNHAWRAIPLSRSLALKKGLAQRVAVAMTFVAVTLAWIPFRADNLADAGRMFTYLWPTTAGPQGLSSFWG